MLSPSQPSKPAPTVETIIEEIKESSKSESTAIAATIPAAAAKAASELGEAQVAETQRSNAESNNIMRQMAATGYLVSGEQYQADIQRFGKTIDSRQMERTITHPVYGVPNAREIVRSADFAPWMEKQPDEIKALFSSPDPFDRIKILKRFVNKGVLGEARQQKEQAEQKRAAAKKNFDAIHKTQKPAGSVKPKKSAMRPEDEEAEAFNSEDE